MLIGFILGFIVAAIPALYFMGFKADAERYQWIRDQSAFLTPNDSISRWLMRRPFGCDTLDSIVDHGLGKRPAPKEAP